MTLAGRRSSIPLSPAQQLNGYVSYDPITRRRVRFIETIVPTLSSDDEIPADIYYADPGSGLSPAWIGIVAAVTTGNWDATEKRFYTLYDGVSEHVNGGIRQAWPTGPFGNAQSFEPKNGTVTKFKMEFRAKFLDNADYTVYGVGLLSVISASTVYFNTATDHFIQVTRNAGNWELGTCDGSTISQSSGAGADANWHDFRVEWIDGEVALFIDEVEVITKTTNLPAQPLAFVSASEDASHRFQVMGVKLSWS